VTTVAANAQSQFQINNSNTFQIYAQLGERNFVFNGVFRQQGAGSGGADCVVYGYGFEL
jgi:hypothetical protein